MSYTNKLTRKIMRRVYYAFALRLITHKLVLSTVFLVLSVYGLSVMVHVASIFDNLRRVQVGRLDNYIANAFLHTDVLTLIFFGLVVFSLLSFNFTLLKVPRYGRMQSA
ncbi:MAG: hypothetical protein RLZZ76_335 [Candidatus Parcubacteria bacterium]